MKKIIILLTVIIFLGCTKKINIHGEISRVGHEPFSYLAIKDQKTNTAYKIINNKSYEKYQNHIKNVSAKIVKTSNSKLIPTEIRIIDIHE